MSLCSMSFCPCNIFQILFICLSVLSYSSLNLRWSIFLSGSLYISILGCLPQRFILFLWWYLVSLILYVSWSLGIALFASEEVAIFSCVNQLALGDKEVRHQSAQLEFRVSLRPFLWVCWLHSSHSLTVGKIRLVCFLSILQSQYECGKPPIYFSQGSALKCSKLRTFSGWGGSSQLLTSCTPSCRGLTCAVCWRVWVLAVDGVRVSDEASCCQEPVSQLLGCWFGLHTLAVSSHPFPLVLGVSRAFPGGSVVKNLRANAGDMASIPGLGAEMAAHSSILAWEIKKPWKQGVSRLFNCASSLSVLGGAG